MIWGYEMGGWLQKILTSSAPTRRSGSLPIQSSKTGHLPAQPLSPQRSKPETLPNATVIYGIGASIMFVASFSLLLAGRWFPGSVVFVLGGCLMGFALHLLKHQD